MKQHSGECGCEGHGPTGHGHRRGGRGWRRYVSPDEERSFIENYISELEAEIAGARKRLEELSV